MNHLDKAVLRKLVKRTRKDSFYYLGRLSWEGLWLAGTGRFEIPSSHPDFEVDLTILDARNIVVYYSGSSVHGYFANIGPFLASRNVVCCTSELLVHLVSPVAFFLER